MFRTALRTSAGAAFRQRSVARRYASSHSKQPAGDATWAMGSAAVFGSITAYLLMSGGSPAEAALHSTSHMKIADATEKDVTPEDAPTLVNTAAESKHKGSGREITSIEGAKSDDSEDSEDKAESSSSSSSSSESKEDDKEESSPAATSEPEEGRKAEDIPESETSGDAIKDSLKKAESVAVPRAAMGKDVGSSKSDESSSSSSSSSEGGEMKAADEGRFAEDIPQEELSKSLHQSEEACVPKATWANGEKAE